MIQINFIQNMQDKIDAFKELDNTYYEITSVEIYGNVKITRVAENRKIKETLHLTDLENDIITCKDLNKKETITIYENSKTYQIESNKQDVDIKLPNLPTCMELLNNIKDKIKNKDIFSIFKSFQILYIVPAKYNGIECYKIRTVREKLYVDRATLYPIYAENEKRNSLDSPKELIKTEYVFEQNYIKDEDVELINLEEYTKIESSEK